MLLARQWAGSIRSESGNMDTSRTNDQLDRVAQITKAYVSRNPLSPEKLPSLLDVVAFALDSLRREPDREPEVDTPSRARVSASIRPEYLVSFENGQRYKTLRHHLTRLGMTPLQYCRKWDLPLNYPMVAADYSDKRSKIAREFGLGTKPDTRS